MAKLSKDLRRDLYMRAYFFGWFDLEDGMERRDAMAILDDLGDPTEFLPAEVFDEDPACLTWPPPPNEERWLQFAAKWESTLPGRAALIDHRINARQRSVSWEFQALADERLERMRRGPDAASKGRPITAAKYWKPCVDYYEALLSTGTYKKSEARREVVREVVLAGKQGRFEQEEDRDPQILGWYKKGDRPSRNTLLKWLK